MSPVILLTGGTGFIGFRVLREALEKGYTVRAVARSEAKADSVRKNPALAHIKNLSSRLQFVQIPDFLKPGAFDDAMQDVKYVVHVANPMPSGDVAQADLERLIVDAAVNSTMSIFEAAKKAGSVKRIVVTSSMAAIPPLPVLMGMQPSEHEFTTDERGDALPPPYMNAGHAYAASKVNTLLRAEEWMKEQKPSFDVIHICPSFVGGRDGTLSSASGMFNGTNGLFMAQVLGKADHGNGMANVMAVASVDDVAKIHIESLQEDKVQGSQVFFVSQTDKKAEWNDAKEIVKKHFPDAVKNGTLNVDGDDIPHKTVYIDVSKTEETFGKLATYEEIMTSVAGQYLELIENEKRA